MMTESGGKFHFSGRAFAQGLFVALLAYLVLAAWIWWQAPETLSAAQARLASITVPITAAPIVVQPAAAVATGSKAPAALVSAPLNGLSEDSPDGPLPVIRTSDGMTPFRAYRRPFDRAAASGHPIISIAVTGLGLSPLSTRDAIDTLPPDVSLVFVPYGANARQFSNEARGRGHEIWLTLPVEPSDYPATDPGPDTLLIGAPAADNAARLQKVLGSSVGYTGFVSSHDPAFLKSASDATAPITDIYARGLGFVDTSEQPGPVPQTLAVTKNSAYAAAGPWLDASATPEDIQKSLAALEASAKAHGKAAGLIRPLPVSMHEIAAWAKTLPAKGITLAPLSAQTGQ